MGRAASGRPLPGTVCAAAGLAQGVPLRRAVAAGAVVRWDDVTLDPTDPAVVLRRTMERRFAPQPANRGSAGARIGR